jgi:hypothetical protein
MKTQDVQFEGWVSASARNLPRSIVELAVSYYVKNGNAERRYVADCVELAGHFSEGLKPDAPVEPLGIFDMAPMPEKTITEAVLIDRLEAEVKELRLELFGSCAPPFSKYVQALNWIEEEAKADRRRVGSNLDKLFESIDALRKLLDQMSDAMGRPVFARLETPLLRYYKPGFGIKGIKVRLGSRLLPLQAFARSSESIYGFSEHQLIAYALVDIPPQLARITIGTEIGSNPKPPKTTITILARHPCWEDLRTAYKLIQQETRRKRARRLAGC